MCSVLRHMGYPVYDCDSRAKHLMDCDPAIKAELRRAFPNAHTEEGLLDRKALSAEVFGKPERLAQLNTIVHGAVRADLRRWCSEQQHNRLFVETAILYQSGLDQMVDCVCQVEAPEELRIERVGRRSGLTSEQTRARMAAQSVCPPEGDNPPVYIINNDGRPVLPQIDGLFACLRPRFTQK